MNYLNIYFPRSKFILAILSFFFWTGIIFAAEQSVIATISVGYKPYGIAVNSSSNTIYVASESGNISVIDGSANTVTQTVASSGSTPQGAAINEATNKIYVINVNSRSLSVIDGETNTVEATISGFGYKPRYVAVNPVTNMAYVSNHGNNSGNTVSVVDGSSNTIITEIQVGNAPGGLDVNPNTNRIYVCNYLLDYVSVIDGATNTVITTIAVGDCPSELAVNPVTNRIYVSNHLANSVSVIDGATDNVIATVGVGSNPRGACVNPVTNQIFISNFNGNTVSVIDGATNTVTNTISSSSGPVACNFNPVTNRVYVANYHNATVSVIGFPNQAPVADAGEDQLLITVNSLVQLDGSTSYDNDGDDLTYSWTITLKPVGSSAALNDATSDTPTFIADKNGKYKIELVVNDGTENSLPDEVIVSFSNIPPVADAGDNSQVFVGELVSLDGGNSSDMNGDPLSYLWSIVSKPLGSTALLSNTAGQNTEIVPDISGEYTISLIVNDGLIDSPEDIVSIYAISALDALTSTLADITEAINNLADGDFKNKKMRKALTNKINATLNKIEAGEYESAIEKLTDDFLKKTDGCALEESPDKNDMIIICEEGQNIIYPLVLEAISYLEAM